MLTGDILKFDTLEDGSLVIEGIASTPDKDHQGEIIEPEAIRKALPEYLRSGSVREMHVTAAGRPLAAFVDDTGKLHLKAKIVDASTITKIKEGILKEFSVGGKALARAGNRVTSMLLKEISVVDHGCNPNTHFTICKVEQTEQTPTPTMTKDDLLKMLADPDVAALIKGQVPAAPALPKTEDLVKALGIEDLQKSLKTIETQAAADKAAADKATRDAIVAEASRDGKVIPLSVENIAKMDVDLLKSMVTLLPKTTITAPKTTPKIDLNAKPEDIKKSLETARKDGVSAMDAFFKSQGALVTA